MDVSTITHLVGQLNGIQAIAKALPEVKNRRELKAKSDEIYAYAETVRGRVVGSHEDDRWYRERIAELEKRVKELEGELRELRGS